MSQENNLLKNLVYPHKSEKVSYTIKNNIITLKVQKKINKFQIKTIIEKFFKMYVLNVNTLIIKGKKKRYKKNIGKNNDWKKAYIKLKSGQNLELFSNTE